MGFMSRLEIRSGRDGVIDPTLASVLTHHKHFQLALRQRLGKRRRTATVLRVEEHARVNLLWLPLPPPTGLCTKIVLDAD